MADTARAVGKFWTLRRVAYACIAVVVFFLGSAVYWNCAGCGQKMARSWGGTYTVDLPAGERLVNATWKDDELWYLHRPMQTGELPSETVFQQKKAGAGHVDGQVVFHEHAR